MRFMRTAIASISWPLGITWFRMRSLPIGVQDFKALRRDGDYFVDKSPLIAQILGTNTKGAYLYTRPRRFGKSLNLSMLDAFLNVQHKGNPWFDGLKISESPEFDRHRNAYPVINVDFKAAETKSFGSFLDSMRSTLKKTFKAHAGIRGSEELDSSDRMVFDAILSKSAGEGDLRSSIMDLSEMLHRHYGSPCAILIDEYDSPLRNAYGKRSHDEVLGFMRSILSMALKGNESMQLAVVTGILQISKESFFSELNNPRVNNILDTESDEMFGFTAEEVKGICAYYGDAGRFEEAKEWYDGYRFGNADIYNPWSVLNYVEKGFRPAAYWANTSRNTIINDMLKRADAETYRNLSAMGSGGSFNCGLLPQVTYADLEAGPDAIYSLLAFSGYLNAVPAGSGSYDLSIPNKELYSVFADLVSRSAGAQPVLLRKFADAVLAGNASAMEAGLGNLLKSAVSARILDHEHKYHLFVLGMLMSMSGDYEVTGDMESGEGYHDIVMRRKRGAGPNVVIEIKKLKTRAPRDVGRALHDLAGSALEQIRANDYAHGLDGPVIAYGVAVHSKTPVILSERLR